MQRGKIRASEMIFMVRFGLIITILGLFSLRPGWASEEPRAADGQTLSGQTAQVQANFRHHYGDKAAERWVEEHNIEIGAAPKPKPGNTGGTPPNQGSTPKMGFPKNTPPPADRHSTPAGGFWSISPTDNVSNRDLDGLRELGVKTVRLVLQQGRSMDEIIRAYSAAGIQVMICACYESYDSGGQTRPGGANDGEWPKWETVRYSREKALGLIDAMREAVPHYRDLGVHCWEIWNEQNAGWKLNPEVYAELLGSVYEKCKTTEKWDPDATIIFGGLDASINEGTTWNAGTGAYLEAFYKSRQYQWFKDKYGHSPFDAIGLHPYGADTADKLNDSVDNVCLAPMQAHGDGDLPVWLTEIGDAHHEDEEQARRIEIQCRAAFSHSAVKKFFLFKYLYEGDSPNSWFSIFRDGRKRAAFDRYKQLIEELGDK